MVLFIHHILQALITLLAMVVISKLLNIRFKDFGFNINKFRYSIVFVSVFLGVWILIQTVVGICLIKDHGVSPGCTFPLNFRNYIGYFLFEVLLSGTSEEIMFRSLAITLMLSLWGKYFSNSKRLSILVIAASAFIFMIAHINFSLFPFRITHFDILQQLTCLASGLCYGYLFIKTKSIVGCMIAHNLLNGIITLLQLLFVLSFKIKSTGYMSI
ncbi:CPBP family intramembrane glutamic endopeptidase [Fontibacillus sp. BL9]|uniref:CPBP family intramembrane glutamic endopeptidase n=1 Tax=Fontibacillus sp. BL9 TaxID=3389971 RepID=UPI0039795724